MFKSDDGDDDDDDDEDDDDDYVPLAIKATVLADNHNQSVA